MHSALLISRLVSISSRKPLSFLRWERIFVTLDEDRTSSFISSLHLRPAVPLRISWTAIEPRSFPSAFGRDFSLPSCPLLRFLSSSPFPPRYPGFLSIAVIRLRLRRRLFSTTSSRSILRAASLFLLSHSGFRSVGLWGRKNERTSERTNGRTQLARCSSLFLIVLSLSVGRRSFVRSFAYSLAQSLGHPSSLSLALRRFCIFIDCHLTSPTTGRPRSAAVSPPLSRVPRFPRPCLILQQQQQQQHRALRGASVPLSCSLFALSRSLRFLSSHFFLALSFGYLSFALVDPHYVLFHSKLHSPSLSRPTFIRVSPCLYLSLSATPWCFYLLRSIQTRWTRQSFRLKLPSGACDIYPHPHRRCRRRFLVLTSTSTSRHR